MNTGWKTKLLRECTIKIASGATPKGGKESYLYQGISLIRSQNIHDFRFSVDGLAFIDTDQAHNLRNVIVEENDVLVNITGDSVARVCSAPKEHLPARVNQHVAIIRPRRDLLDWNFLKYFLLSPGEKANLLMLSSSGATRNALTKGMLENLKINLPQLPEQKAIANILGTLDEKIELNRQMNQTLEAMAQALFKSWFVDFDPVIDNVLAQGNEFPEELQARAEKRRHVIAPARCGGSEEERPKQSLKPLLHTNPALAAQFPESFVFNETLGKWIPEGWEVKRIGECDIYISDFVANGSFASLKENVTLYPDKKEYALFMRNTDLKSGFEKKVYVDKRSYEFLKKSRLLGGEVIISNVGDVGSVYRCPDLDIPMTLGNNVILLNSSFNNFLYQFFICPLGQALIDGIKGGSAQPKFNKTDFKSQSILVPSNEILAEFERIDSINRTKLESLKRKIETLTQLRDRLLPELISGRVRVKDIKY